MDFGVGHQGLFFAVISSSHTTVFGAMILILMMSLNKEPVDEGSNHSTQQWSYDRYPPPVTDTAL